jgi:P27 family predicted phage terminase small subunit
MRGRRPKPTALKILENNRGRRPLNDREPHHASIAPGLPSALKGHAGAAAEWRRIIGTLGRGHVTDVDRAILIAYCLKYEEWQTLERQAASAKAVIVARSGYPMPNPLRAMANKALTLMLKAAVELGITPSARARIVLAPHDVPENQVDEFTAYQRRRLGVS